MRDPPHRREPENLTNLTSQGYSFFSAGWPPTILLSLLLGTPHTHGASVLVVVVGGWAVVVGDGFGGGTNTMQPMVPVSTRWIEKAVRINVCPMLASNRLRKIWQLPESTICSAVIMDQLTVLQGQGWAHFSMLILLINRTVTFNIVWYFNTGKYLLFWFSHCLEIQPKDKIHKM